MKSGAAKPFYEQYIKVAEAATDDAAKARYKNFLVESYQYRRRLLPECQDTGTARGWLEKARPSIRKTRPPRLLKGLSDASRELRTSLQQCVGGLVFRIEGLGFSSHPRAVPVFWHSGSRRRGIDRIPRESSCTLPLPHRQSPLLHFDILLIEGFGCA